MEAKLLYGLMLDRMGLSVRNSWLDSDGKVYIFFTLEDALAVPSYSWVLYYFFVSPAVVRCK